MTGSVYFIECRGRIKIGHSKDVSARLRELGTGSPDPLTLIATVPGSQQFERAVHAALGNHRENGEWFRDCLAVRSMMSAIQERGHAAIGFRERPKPSPTSQALLLTQAIVLVAQQVFHPSDVRKRLAEISGCSMRTVDNWRAGTYPIKLETLLALFECEHGDKFFQAFWETLPVDLRERWLERELARRESGVEVVPQ